MALYASGDRASWPNYRAATLWIASKSNLAMDLIARLYELAPKRIVMLILRCRTGEGRGRSDGSARLYNRFVASCRYYDAQIRVPK
jgi:hypothetical protein